VAYEFLDNEDWSSEENRQKRQYRRKVIEDWKAHSKAIRDADPSQRMLMREADRISLTQIEDAARTVADFENVKILWNNLEIVERYRLKKHEEKYDDELPDMELPERSTIIPPPLGHVWWRQLLGGDFLDVIHDCPYDIPEMTSSRPVIDFTSGLDDMHLELMYYWVIRQWSPQRIAAFFDRTDRNIRKVYGTMIENIRRKLFMRLYPRYVVHEPLTNAQREFCRVYEEQLDDARKAKITKKIEQEARSREKEERRNRRSGGTSNE
jgi:hypothetical protein